MTGTDHTRLATGLVVVTGTLWGLYWIPVRQLEVAGLTGAWGTAAIVGAATLLLLPLALRGRQRLRRSDLIGLAYVALGGVAFVCYSVGFLYGRVAIIAILFFLTPVWSTLIGHFIMGWPTTRMRLLALGLGVAGLALMLGAGGEVPIPRGIGEWLGLLSGLLWSIATTGMRVRPVVTRPAETAFVFALGATVAAVLFAIVVDPIPAPGGDVGRILILILATGGLWWSLSMIALMWATPQLEPTRVGILLMAEVLVGAASAAVLAGEHLSFWEVLGGALVLLAGVCEVWPARVVRGGTG